MRLDKYLITKKLIDTRSQAIYFIKSKKIKVNDEIVIKPAYILKPKDEVKITPKNIYVSKGGYKLEAFLDKISFSVENKVILDIGCSTGGFTHYFLKNNAKKVVAVDIAKDILSKKIINNNLEYYDGFDILDKNNISLFKDKFDVISIDVSDTSVREVLIIIKDILKKNGSIIALFKPHYEGKIGLVSKEDKEELINSFEKWLQENTPFKIIHKINSSERGGYNLKGNREVFYLLKLK